MGMMMQKGLCPFLNEGVHHMSTADGKKIAIVTGSALGLGYELARQLIAKGWFVAGIDFNGARQTELSKTFAADEYRAFVGRYFRRIVREELCCRNLENRSYRFADQQCRSAFVQSPDRIRGGRCGQVSERSERHGVVERGNTESGR